MYFTDHILIIVIPQGSAQLLVVHIRLVLYDPHSWATISGLFSLNSPSFPNYWMTSLCSLSVSRSSRNCQSWTCPLSPLLIPGDPSGLLFSSPTLATPRVTGFFLFALVVLPPPHSPNYCHPSSPMLYLACRLLHHGHNLALAEELQVGPEQVVWVHGHPALELVVSDGAQGQVRHEPVRRFDTG